MDRLLDKNVTDMTVAEGVQRLRRGGAEVEEEECTLQYSLLFTELH